jgi:hypothetical protein
MYFSEFKKRVFCLFFQVCTVKKVPSPRKSGFISETDFTVSIALSFFEQSLIRKPDFDFLQRKKYRKFIYIMNLRYL